MGKPSADPPVTGLERSPLGSGAQQGGWYCGAPCDDGSNGRTLPIGPMWPEPLPTSRGAHGYLASDEEPAGSIRPPRPAQGKFMPLHLAQ